MKYAKIISKAQECKDSVKKEYKLGVSKKWCYYFGKAILKPKTDIPKLDFEKEATPQATHISRQISKADYVELAKKLTAYVEKHHQLPNYVSYKDYKIKIKLLTYVFAKVLLHYNKDGKLPSEVTINSKIFTKPVETKNEVYNYFVSVFGKVNTIDEALSKIAAHSYGYYYDDVYSNKEAINRMKNRKGVNCTDSCQVFYNIVQQLIQLGKYKKVECLHVKCQGGDGHVRLRITLNDGTMILRDPAAVLDSGNITHNWCLNGTLLSINPSWFMNNLHR